MVWSNSSTLRRRKPSTSDEDVESRFPVGSSAKMIRGRLTKARAQATLLLTAGEFAGTMAESVPQSDGVDDAVEPFLVRVCGRRCPTAV